MTCPLVVLRPAPGLGETLALARAMGMDPVAAPLFAITAVDWDAPDPAGFDAIVAGSANAFRVGGEQLGRLTALPVYAVGDRTAEAARAAGFRVVAAGSGGLQELVATMPGPQHLLRLAGERRVTLCLPAGMTMAECVLYRADPLPLASTAAELLHSGAVVLLHSGEAARRFANECDRLAVDRSGIALAALAPRIAAAAGQGWQTVAVAPQTTDAALLAMAADMCQTRA